MGPFGFYLCLCREIFRKSQGLGQKPPPNGKSLFGFIFSAWALFLLWTTGLSLLKPKACMVNPNDGRPNGLRRRITCLGGLKKKQVRMGRLQNRESRWKKLHKLLANSTVEVCVYQFLQEFRGIGCTFQGLYQGANLVNC